MFWDVETKRWFDEVGGWDPAKLGVSIVSVYRRTIRVGEEFWPSKISEGNLPGKGEMKSFWVSDLEQMWQMFYGANRVIGFNSLEFDVPVIKPYAPADFSRLAHFDILAKIKEMNEGRGAGLEAIARASLGIGKAGSGEEAIEYWRRGDKESLKKLRQYCEADVKLTRDVYDFGVKNGHVKFVDRWNNLRQVKVDFGYPKDQTLVSQSVLF